MTAQDLRDKFSVEMKQHPQQAVLLGLGLVVALVVWAPRLKGMLGGEPAAESAGSASASPGGVEGVSSGETVLDTLAMLGEFRDISNEARALSRFVAPIMAPPSPASPFHDEELERAQAEAASAATRITASPQPSNAATAAEVIDPIDHDQETVSRLKLTGVFLFGDADSALIDGELRRRGDVIGNLRITAIESRAVILRGARGVYRIEMKDALAPKTPVAAPPQQSPLVAPGNDKKDGS